ncbi:hypothetical protein [Fischerella sp. PCC 9605]|uniref:hypothetical protein n=1 Tax=Fischerella sp. PCC 9605 TaxID=1173024 RepID=UPI00047B65CE|nr:hypothetical protein [Fischerella sp. PCC 9605]
MLVYWKPIIIEVLLEVLLELAPGSIDTLATCAEYLIENSWETSKASIQLVLAKINYQVDCQLPHLSHAIASPAI